MHISRSRHLAAAAVLVAATIGFSGRAGVAWQAAAQGPRLIPEVRAAVAKSDFAAAERLIAQYQASRGVTPEMLEAQSWLGRGALAAKQLDQADAYARKTYELAKAALKGRTMDQEPHLPIALGAAIEVRAQVAAQQGGRSEAVTLLQREIALYGDTSIAKRLQKNVNLITLEGTPAPALDLSESLAAKPLSLDAVKGKAVVVFFWAHWCPDCKNQGPELASLLSKYGSRGFTVIAPTQRYGYVAGGRDAAAPEENQYIAEVRATHYGFLAPETVTLSEKNHLRYGVSTTPTLVVLDRKGIVRLYHPGQMTEAELEPLVRRLVEEGSSPRRTR
jgi:thiol-disulfide isomerase/thioredoxin